MWQPFGPSDDPRRDFAHPGWHYRGFPAIPVCDPCAARIAAQADVTFLYAKTRYHYVGAANDVFAEGETTSSRMVHWLGVCCREGRHRMVGATDTP
jgi:hypothetical protein